MKLPEYSVAARPAFVRQNELFAVPVQTPVVLLTPALYGYGLDELRFPSIPLSARHSTSVPFCGLRLFCQAFVLLLPPQRMKFPMYRPAPPAASGPDTASRHLSLVSGNQLLLP